MKSPHLKIDGSGSSTVIGNILMVALTVLIGGVVAIQAARFMDAIDFSNSGFGKNDEIDISYSMVLINGNLTITLERISERIKISSVNYQYYDLTLDRSEEDGYLIDIEGSNDSWIRFNDRDNDDHFSPGDTFFLHMGNGTIENEYILRLNHNRHHDVVYEVSITEDEIKRL